VSSSSREDLKRRVCDAIDARREHILAMARDIERHPELGFQEHRTADIVARTFADLGLSVERGLAVTGVKARLPGGSAGPTVAILGELDALPVPTHPLADPATGAAHACGHFAQIGMLLGSAIGLVEAKVAPHLGGQLAFIATPAEEMVQVEWRLGLRDEGKIEFLGGKQELIRLGAFDDVEIALITHSSGRPETLSFEMGATNNGHVVKHVRYLGKSSHAGSAPHLGVNALKAAMLGLAGIDAQRETFRDDDTVRVHPILTKGGDSVNAVPADVRIETFIRGKRLAAIEDASVKVDRALRAGALAVGARVDIATMPGYLPLLHEPDVAAVYRDNALALVGSEGVTEGAHGTFSTDVGDLSHVVAVSHPFAGGARGVHHGPEFRLYDEELAILNPAKVMAMSAIDLLADGAARGGEILRRYTPRMTRDEYLAYLRRTFNSRVYDESNGLVSEPGV
jgi:amidohydrolase